MIMTPIFFATMLLWAIQPASAQSGMGDPAPFIGHIPAMMTVPNAVDTDQNGELSVEEIMAAAQNLKALDKDGDGALSSREIGAYAPKLPLVRSHFITNLIDADGDVSISAEEIKNAAGALKILDRDGNWHVSKGELTLWRKPGSPTFTKRKLTTEQWKKLRHYSPELDGTILPGQDERAAKGFTLIHDAGDFNQIQQTPNTTYLLNEMGEKVHEWPSDGYLPEASVSYLLPNGHLLRTLSNHHWIEDKHFPVGAHSSVQLVDWDGEVVWQYSMSVPEKYSFHHDVAYMPNRNILAIRYTAFTIDEAMALGWDADLGRQRPKIIQNRINRDGSRTVWLDSILELQPNLEDGSTEIVWQWNSWDHLVQNKYALRSNYGDITDPDRIHINYVNLDTDVPFNAGQMFHMNAIDYNPDLDIIMVSVPVYGEIWFIDHGTTTQQAASSEGGRRNKGGDLLYRWGNDEAFGAGVRDDSHLYWQHDAHWIEEGRPGAGNILIYNNGSRRTLDGKYMREAPANIMTGSHTDLLEVQLPVDRRGRFNRRKKPKIVWSWEDTPREDYFSPFMSGLQRLPNGNTIFCRAYDRQITEVTPDGEKVLDYSPAGWGRLHRVYKYPATYPGLMFDRGGRR